MALKKNHDIGIGLWLWLTIAFSLLAIPLATVLSPAAPYPSRAMCWNLDPALIAVHAWGNIAIWLEYVIIPSIFMWLFWVTTAWKAMYAFPALACEGAAFIFTCGLTHLMARIEVYQATPWVAGGSILLCVVAGAIFIAHLLYRLSEVKRWLSAVVRSSELERLLIEAENGE